MLEILSTLYFVFVLVTNIMFFKISNKVLDKPRFGTKILYLVAAVNAAVFTYILYGFNQLPTITYLMVLFGGLIELVILFKNHIWGTLMCSLISVIYLVCVESITISLGVLLRGKTIADVTHDHIALISNIVFSWAICAIIGILINKLVPGKYLKIVNEHKEQTIFMVGFLLITATYLTLNSFIYGYSDTFDKFYLPLHQVITPLTWLAVVTLAMTLLIRFDYLHGYKVRADMLLETIDRQKLELVETQNRAERDSLVNAYNKNATHEKISESLKDIKSGAFFIIDIDDFKGINDTKGHPFGDKVLIYLFKRISHMVRARDIVGRVGGDEAIVFLQNAPSVEIVRSKAETLCNDVNVPFCDDNGTRVNVSISVGIALYPEHGDTFEELYKNADTALYQSKKKGKNTFSIYEK